MLPSFKEDHISQIPALQFLQKAGYQYLTPEEANNYRGNKQSNVIMEGILEEQLNKLNGFEFGGQSYKFSNVNIHNAISELKDFSLKNGLIRTNEQVYDLITLGKSFEENIKGDRKSFNIRYIDWKNPSNNVFHVTEEFSVQRSGSFQSYRPDIVLFINGIPLVIIECKRPDLVTSDNKKPIEQAVSQHIRNQEPDGIQYLYIFSQILLSVCSNDAKYATTGSKPKYWFYWKEQNSMEEEIDKLINKSLTDEQKDKLFSTRFKYVRDYFESKEQSEVEITQQDKLLYSLCKPARLLELVYKFIVYDAGIKKIARYQQYFAVKNTIDRVNYTDRGKRRGGVIWHTQGSGKSLTMVWLAKSLALEPAILNPGIVLVTDRIDLDDQIYKTFKNCDKEVVQAKTGKHLVELINIREEIKTLSEKHSHLWDLFKSIEKKKDEEAFEQLLADKSLRDKFYERLSAYVRTLKIAMSSFEFIEKTPERTVEKYRNDAKFFLQLRVSVKARYSDAIDYKQYETQVQKLIDTHITSGKIIKLTDQVNIFEKEKFEEEVEKVIGKAAKADMIASRTAKTITERMEDDPAFYKKFSRLLEETIEEYRQRRIDEIEYLENVLSMFLYMNSAILNILIMGKNFIHSRKK